ncbi:MAG TPA: site-2 protease family protein [Cellvibrio sp.]|nr:site-2 protease family protein [Cellvibrio sp.]
MQMFSFIYAGREFVIEATPATGEELVKVDGETVSHLRNFNPISEHRFDMPDLGDVRIGFQLNVPAASVIYQMWVGEVQALGAQARLITVQGDAEQLSNSDSFSTDAIATPKPAPVKNSSWLSLALVGFKLLKTVQVIKVALLAASVAVYSVMFTVEFALALIGVLVFHEYGHLRAMKKCGLPTKGMYLIPFVGGLAVGDMPKSRWQDVYISMMGPVFGLLMTLVFYIFYLITESHFAGLVASTSALLNLFNLIPVYPLDGGRVVKSLVFSGRNYLALIALLGISALCFVFAWKMGFYFITFFIVIGVIDIVAGWRVGLAEDITPLNRYGIWYSLLWYLVVVALFLGMIVLIAQDALPGSEIAMKVLSS